jgi:hypothetical protein
VRYLAPVALGLLIGALALAGAVYALDYCKAYRAEAPAPVLLKGQAMAWSWAPPFTGQGPHGSDARGWEATP